MTNFWLCLSSVLMTGVHISMIFESSFLSRRPVYTMLWIRGCVSSIANHSTRWCVAKHYDRSVMVESAIADAVLIIFYGLQGAAMLLATAVFLYALAKLCSLLQANYGHRIYGVSVGLHALAHLSITLTHCMLINRL
jgi:hypothetical protein